MGSSKKVLYAEDEAQLSAAVVEILQMEGFDVTAVPDGISALEELKSGYFDVVVLDIMMPGMSGMEVLQDMRARGDYTAVMMLTAKTTVNDRVSGLAGGADDYLAKPFSMRELVARVDALVRRNEEYRHGCVSVNGTTLDEARCELATDVGSLRLSTAETELLSFLMKNIGERYSAQDVCDRAWGGDGGTDKVVLYMMYLKEKLSQLKSELDIHDKRGIYTLELRR